jgi:nitrite reductase (NO-forming)
MDRKNFLQWLGIGGTFLSGGYFLNKKNQAIPQDFCQTPIERKEPTPISYLSSEGRPGYNLSPNAYGGMVHAPLYLKEEYGKRFYFQPGKVSKNSNDLEISSYNLNLSIAHGITTEAWTFNGIVPGPILRYKEGDTIKIKFINKTNDIHSLHFHGNHNPTMDGWEGVPAFSEFEYSLECDPPGVHPYHCHVPPIAKHISKGLYGVLIIDPLEERKPAHEFVLVLSGWDLENRSRNDIYTWNGIAGYYERFPIKVPVGERVRLYIINMLEYDSLMTFHLHGRTFDIYKSMKSKVPDGHSDVVCLGPTERAILEFTLEKKGRYMFHPHESRMAERGAMGWIVGI